MITTTTTKTIRVHLNGEAIDTPARTIADLLQAAGYGNSRVATARNGEFVAEAKRDSTALMAGDRIEVVAPRQGG